MDSLSQLQVINSFLVRDCQEKDKFIEGCGGVLRHCQCGVVSERLLEDLTYIENKINTPEYKNLILKIETSLDYQSEPPKVTNPEEPNLEVKTEVVTSGELLYEVLQSEDAAQGNVTADVQRQSQYGDYTPLAMTEGEDITSRRDDESVVTTITTHPSYPETPSVEEVTSTAVDTSECIVDAPCSEISSALDSLKAVAIVTGNSGPVVVYEQLSEDGQVIVVTSEQSVNLTEDQVEEITVLAETASLQPPILDSITEDENSSVKEKKGYFATEEEEKQLLGKITAPPVPVKEELCEDKVFKCYICSKAYSKQQSLKDHLITHDKARREKFKCTVCGKGFSKPYMVKSHMETHNRIKPFQCSVCNKKFSQRSCATRHMKIHTKEKPYGCSICDKRFNQLGHAKKHMAMHSEMRHKCHLCPRTFPTLVKLTNHLALHNKLAKKKSTVTEGQSEKPLYFKELLTEKGETVMLRYSCKYCPERFATKPELDIHDESHAEERPFQCDICGLRCIKEKNLTFHKNSHTKNADNVCDICGERFRTVFWLQNHLLKHNGIKPFMCEDCGEVFTLQSNLSRHQIKEHNHQPNRKCHTCGQHFPSFKALKHHRTKFHRNEKKVYQCRKCGENCFSISSLVKHHRTHLEELKDEDEDGPAESKTDDHSPTQEKKPTRSSNRTTPSKWRRKQTSDSVEKKQEDSIKQEPRKDPQEDSKTEIWEETVMDRHGKLKKPCPLCGKMLHPTSIYKHIKSHDGARTSNRPFTKTGQRRQPCKVCNMLISKTSEYTHMRIHRRRGDIPEESKTKVDDGKVREPCDICGKLCTPQSLPRHKVIHLPVRPYSCDVCGKRFNQISHVPRHKRTQHPGI